MANLRNILDQYQTIAAVKDKCIKNKTSYFVQHGESSKVVHNERTDSDLTVNIVMNDADGPDNAFIFALTTDDLVQGDYITFDSATFILYESVRVIKDVDFKKFKAYECNALVNGKTKGYFYLNPNSPKDTVLDKSLIENSQLLPTLIVPASAGIQIGDYIKIDDQTWLIEEANTFADPGIGYYYMRRSPNSNVSMKGFAKDKSNVAYKGMHITLATEKGYYSSSVNLTIVKRTGSAIEFIVPSADFTITVKKNDVDVIYSYTVKENI